MKTVEKILNLIKNIIGTKYVFLTPDMNNCGQQSYVSGEKIPTYETIKNIGIDCVGVINLVRRYLNLEIPGLVDNHKYAGGTAQWFYYLKKNNKLKKFSIRKNYPAGTLLIRNYKSVKDQGHVAIVYKKSKSILFSELIHSYTTDKYCPENFNKKLEPGLCIDKSVGQSYFWNENGYYTHICLPDDWLF